MKEKKQETNMYLLHCKTLGTLKIIVYNFFEKTYQE